MKYILNVFDPDTWAKFLEHDAKITGFKEVYRRIATERVEAGDVFLCYLTKGSRWCGALYVTSGADKAEGPVFKDPDPFTVRFSVDPLVLLEPNFAILIKNPSIWNRLSITRSHDPAINHWTAFFRNPLRLINDADGDFLLSRLVIEQHERRAGSLGRQERRDAPHGGAVNLRGSS